MRLEIRNRLHSTFNKYNLWRLEKNVVQLTNVAELKKLFGWTKDAVLQDPTLNDF